MCVADRATDALGLFGLRQLAGSPAERSFMNSLERFYKTIAYEPVDRPACWMGDPTPAEAAKLCEYYGVANTSELKKVVGDDFYAVEIPYHSPTCNAIFAAFDW